MASWHQEAEDGLIGAILIDDTCLSRVSAAVSPDDVEDPYVSSALKACLAIDERGDRVDMLSLSAEIRRQGDAVDIHRLSACIDRALVSRLDRYIDIVSGRALVRKVVSAARAIVHDGMSEPAGVQDFIDRSESLLLETTRGERAAIDVVSVSSQLQSVRDGIERAAERGGICGLTTGYMDLDRITSGLQTTDLIIIAGRPSMGKTALAVNIATNAARSRAKVLILSLEMGREQIAQRMLASIGLVPLSHIRDGRACSMEDWPRIAAASEVIEDLDVSICDKPALTIYDARARARRMQAIHGLDLLIVDYLQLMRGRSRRPETRDIEIGQISSGLKALAKELRIPVVCLSQLNRALESRADKRPILSDLRESGNIEQDADIVLCLYRDEMYNPATPDEGIAEVIVRKQRNGPTGTVKLRYRAPFTRFEDTRR